MATLVQQPELAQVQVSNLQATQRPPETEFGLSDFAMGVLSAGAKFVGDYNEDNKSRLVALGMTDYMNKTQREVGFLDRKYYGQGRDIQNITEQRLARQQLFTSEIQRLAKDPTTTPEQLDELGQEYQRANVDDIYAATALDSDYKEKLYVQVLEEDTVYMQAINDTIKAVNEERYVKFKLDTGAAVYNDMLTRDFSDGTMPVYLNAKFDSIVEYAKSIGKKPEEALAEAKAVMTANITTQIKQLSVENPNTSTAMRNLRSAAQHLIAKGQVDTASPILDEIRTKTDELFKYNDTQNQLKIKQFIHDAEMGYAPFTTEAGQKLLTEVQNDPNISYEEKARASTEILSYAEKVNAATLNGDYVKTPEYVLSFDNAEAYAAANFGQSGATEEHWRNTVISAAEQTANYDPYTAGQLLLEKNARSSRFDPIIQREAGQRLTSGILNMVRGSEKLVKDSPEFQAANKRFNDLGVQYRQWASTDMDVAKADALLSGIEDDVARAALQQVWAQGGTISDLRELVQNPVQTKARLEYYNKARDSLTYKDTKNSGSIFSNSRGTLGSKMDNDNKEFFVARAQETIEASRHNYTSRTMTPNPVDLYKLAVQDGAILRNDYSDIFLGGATNRRIKENSIRMPESNVAINSDMLADVINGKREIIARNLQIEPENVVVQFSNNGSAYFYALKDGVPQNFTGVAGMEGNQYRETEWLRDIESTYKGRVAQGTSTKATNKTFQSGAAMGKPQRINVVGRNGKMTVQEAILPVDLSLALGKNIPMTQALMNGWIESEHFALYEHKTNVNTAGQREGSVIGFGIRTDIHTKGKGKEFVDRMRAAQGNLPAMLKINGEFMDWYYKSSRVDVLLDAAGLPKPTQAMYNTKAQPAAVALYDAIWLGGHGVVQRGGEKGTGGKLILQAFLAQDEVTGMRIFRNSKMYMEGKAKGTPAANRNQRFIDGIQYYHRFIKPTLKR